MKKIFFLAIAAFALCTAAVTAATTAKPVAKAETEMAVPPFKVATMAATVTINCINSENAQWYLAANDSFTLALTNVKPGGTYTLMVKKTISAPVLVTTSATGVNGSSSPISLTGAANTWFTIKWTNYGGTVLIWKE